MRRWIVLLVLLSISIVGSVVSSQLHATGALVLSMSSGFVALAGLLSWEP